MTQMNVAARWLVTALVTLGGAQAPQEVAISVNVNLVVLQVTVRDRNGAAAGELREADFTVFEDGVKQSVRVFRHEDTPVTAGLVVDHSGSMRTKLADVVEAARAFVRFSRPDDEMFAVNFNENVTLGLEKPGVFTNRQEEIGEAVAKMAAAGQTALYDAVVEGLRQLRNGNLEKKVLLVISDGADNTSTHTLPETLRMAVEANVAIYTIGIYDESDQDRNLGVLRRLSRETGGETYILSGSKSVAAICEQIAGDIRRQYTLGYVSTNGDETRRWRRVRVTVPGKLTAHTRAGYIAGGAR